VQSQFRLTLRIGDGLDVVQGSRHFKSKETRGRVKKPKGGCRYGRAERRLEKECKEKFCEKNGDKTTEEIIFLVMVGWVCLSKAYY